MIFAATSAAPAGLITTEMAVAKLEKLGWEFPENAAADLDAAAAAAAAAADPFAQRLNEEEQTGEEEVPV